MGSYIDWKKERVSVRMLGPKGGWIVISHIGWRGERNILYKGVVLHRLEKETSVSEDAGP